MPTFKPKSPASKSEQGATNPRLKVKPAKDLEPDAAQTGKVRGGNGGAGGVRVGTGTAKGGLVFSDARLKREVATIRGAVALLRRVGELAQ